MMTAGGAHAHGFTRRAGDIPHHLYPRIRHRPLSWRDAAKAEVRKIAGDAGWEVRMIKIDGE
jgi:hypothetical protein